MFLLAKLPNKNSWSLSLETGFSSHHNFSSIISMLKSGLKWGKILNDGFFILSEVVHEFFLTSYNFLVDHGHSNCPLNTSSLNSFTWNTLTLLSGISSKLNSLKSLSSSISTERVGRLLLDADHENLNHYQTSIGSLGVNENLYFPMFELDVSNGIILLYSYAFK